MAATFLDIAITPDVMDVQHEMGSDSLWQTPHSRRQADRFGDSEAGMIATRDSFYLATCRRAAGPTFSIAAARRGFCICWMTLPWRWPISAVTASTSLPAICAAATGPACF